MLTSLDADDLDTASGLVISLLRNPLLGMELLHLGAWARPGVSEFWQALLIASNIVADIKTVEHLYT